MRSKEKYKFLRVRASTHKRVFEDKKHFNDTIDGGEWSVDDTITEYHKMLNGLNK